MTFNRYKVEPTEKQLRVCMDILRRVGECKADEHGQPLFELSMGNADDFIKAHTSRSTRSTYEPQCEAGDWGGIPNH